MGLKEKELRMVIAVVNIGKQKIYSNSILAPPVIILHYLNHMATFQCH